MSDYYFLVLQTVVRRFLSYCDYTTVEGTASVSRNAYNIACSWSKPKIHLRILSCELSPSSFLAANRVRSRTPRVASFLALETGNKDLPLIGEASGSTDPLVFCNRTTPKADHYIIVKLVLEPGEREDNATKGRGMGAIRKWNHEKHIAISLHGSSGEVLPAEFQKSLSVEMIRLESVDGSPMPVAYVEAEMKSDCALLTCKFRIECVSKKLKHYDRCYGTTTQPNKWPIPPYIINIRLRTSKEYKMKDYNVQTKPVIVLSK